jgi:hypothetical protein
MIQRIQSVYLFLTTILSVLFLKGNILSFIDKAGTTINLTFNAIEQTSVSGGSTLIEKVYPLAIAVILIAILSFATIFIYKKRIIQILLIRILIVFVIFLIIACAHSAYLIITKNSAELVPGIRMVFPVLMLIFLILALRGIRKDDDLVKSYDRLR